MAALASILFLVVVTLLADILIIAILESTDDLDEIFLNCGVISGVAVALLLLAPIAIDIPTNSRSGVASAALLGPAGVFFVLKGTRTPRWLKWAFFAFLYVPTAFLLSLSLISTD